MESPAQLQSVTFRLCSSKNDTNDEVAVTLSSIQVQTLTHKSEFLKELVETYALGSEGTESPVEYSGYPTVTLIEDDPFDALTFLIEIVKSTGDGRPYIWKDSWAKLSDKWIVPSFIHIFGEIITSEIENILAVKSILVKINDYPQASGEYRVHADDPNRFVHESNPDHRFQYDQSNRKWSVIVSLSPTANITATNGSSPELYECTGSWTQTLFRQSNKLEISIRVRVIDEAAQQRFIDLVHFILSHASYQTTVGNQDDVLSMIADNKQLWATKVLDTLLTKEAVLRLFNDAVKDIVYIK